MGLKPRLLVWFLGVALIPMTVVSVISYHTARNTLYKGVCESLVVCAKDKAAYINNWFSHRLLDLRSQATSPDNVRFLQALGTAFDECGVSLAEFVQSPEWQQIVNVHGDDLTTFWKIYGFYDAFLIDRKGNVLFTAAREDDLGANLFEGFLADSRFASASRQALASPDPVFSDLEYYVPSNKAVAGFLVQRMVDDQGEVIGLFALQIPHDWIEDAIRVTTGREVGVHAYVVGYEADHQMATLRTQLSPELDARRGGTDQEGAVPDYLHYRVDTEQTRLWIRQHRSPTGIKAPEDEHAFVYTGPNGEEVLGAHYFLAVENIVWGVITEIPSAIAFAPTNALRNVVILLVVITGIVVAIIAILTTGRIVRPILELAKAASLVAHGEFNRFVDIESRDEIGVLANSFNQMVSDLSSAAEAQSRQAWLREGHAGLAEVMRGVQDVTALSLNIITRLARHIEAQVAAFYLVDRPGHLRFASGFAMTKDSLERSEFDFGQGLPGQVAAERQHIVVDPAPDDYIKVCSSLGDCAAKTLLVWPIVRNQEVKAVLELGMLCGMSDRIIEFMMLTSESIAIALDVANARHRQQELLEESQAQSEALQVQTAALQVSEESLQQQSEELQAANEELEEKTQYLERQKREIEDAKQAVEEKAEELARASKYKSEFLANMSHELRTPLNSLLLLAKALSDNEDGNLTPDQVDAANVIYGGGQELLTLINDILDLSKVESGKMDLHIEPVSLRTLITRLHSQFAGTAEHKGIALQMEIAPDLRDTLTTDGKKLEQILRNLLSNALKFTEYGSVRLNVKRPDPQTVFSTSGLARDRAIAFVVQDTGVGIPQEKQQAIFESFQQADGSTSRKYGGTGLGLTISREFVRLLGGEVCVESTEGVGSCFTIFLPLESAVTSESVASRRHDVQPGERDERHARKLPLDERGNASNGEPSEKARAAALSGVCSSGRCILIVEDDARFARVLMGLCRQRGFTPLVAETGADALAMVAEYAPSAILLDLGLPDLDGRAVLEELKSNLATRHIPVHVISASEENGVWEKGAISFLDKPVETEDILRTLNEVERELRTVVKHLLIVEEDVRTRETLAETMRIDGVEVLEAASPEEGLEKLKHEVCDCVVLSGAGTASGKAGGLLKQLAAESVRVPPVVVYGGSRLSDEERKELRQSGAHIVFEDTSSMGHLLDKVSLFLHSVESALPEAYRREIRMLHDPAGKLAGKVVLVVDDDMRNTFALAKILERNGMKVLLAENGKLALEAIEQHPKVDLVIMDIMMPVMNGYEAIRRIRENEQTSDLPIIALTAKAMSEDRSKCVQAGANDYLTKPVNVDRLLSLLRVWSPGRK